MRKNGLLVLLALFVPIALVAAGCGDDDDSGDDTEQTDSSNDASSDDSEQDVDLGDIPSESEVVDAIADTFSADGTLTDDQADCLAEYVVDEVGYEELVEAGFADASGDVEATAEVQADMQSALLDAFGECDVELPTG